MSIRELREDLNDIPGANEIVMRYGEQGKEIYSFGAVTVEFKPMTGREEIATELRKAAAANG